MRLPAQQKKDDETVWGILMPRSFAVGARIIANAGADVQSTETGGPGASVFRTSRHSSNSVSLLGNTAT
jgi:hypothetical protein